MKRRRLWQVRSFQVAKAGNAPDECEDAFAWDEAAGLFAIADGATDAAFQRLWAQLLVESFVQDGPEEMTRSSVAEWLSEWLPAVRSQWSKRIPWETLPWHGLNKARQTGGLATFLGLSCLAGEGRWQAVAVGDCTLMHISSELELLSSAPLFAAADFGNSPVALSSIHDQLTALLPHLHCFGGEFCADDTLLLATDALAVWVLGEIEQGNQPMAQLLGLRNPVEYAAWVDERRDHKQIRNDDTSLLIVTWAPSEEIDDENQECTSTAAG